jgi:hypothetical protein
MPLCYYNTSSSTCICQFWLFIHTCTNYTLTPDLLLGSFGRLFMEADLLISKTIYIWLDMDLLVLRLRNYYCYVSFTVHAVAQRLRRCVTNRKVAGSIPDGVIGIFHWHNPSGRTMVLGSTQPLTEMSTRNISWGKGGRCVGLTTLPPSCADCLKIWEPQSPGTVRACQGL